MKINFVILFILFSSIINFAQISPSVSNLLRYGNGFQNIEPNNSKQFEYFENLTDVRISLPKKITLGFRFLYDNPPEVGDKFKGISRRFIEYKNKGLYLRIGNSSELYGRGLVLNLFENRGLAYDTWLDGIKAHYKYYKFKFSLIAGTINYRDSVNIVRYEKYKLRGGNIEYKIKGLGKLGASFIGSEAIIPQSNISKVAKAELPGFYMDFNYKKINFYFGWAHKWVYTPADKSSSQGNGFYSSFSYAGKKLGITVDYKNYKFDLQNPFLKNDVTRTTKFLPFQNPPIVMKEHSYTLLSRAMHVVDFNNEVGFQLDAIYNVNEKFNLNLNMSLASYLQSYVYNKTDFTFMLDESNEFFPSAKINFSPYYEMFLEGEYYFNINTVLRLGIAKREKSFYNDITGTRGSHTIKSLVIPTQFQYPFTKYLSAIFQYEFEKVDDNFNVGEESFNNHFFSIVASVYNKLTISFRYEHTTNNFDLSGRKDWLLGEVGYRLSGSNLIALSYGRERGGQICSNGICRYTLPFKGFRFSFQTNI